MSTPSVSKLRRRAAKLGWSFHRSTWRKDTCDNKGAYQLVAGGRTAGTVIDGDRYDASLEQIADLIEREEGRLA
jgi:hypothetical protein